MGKLKRRSLTKFVKKRNGSFYIFNMIGSTLFGCVVLVVAAVAKGNVVGDKEDTYESLQLLQMSTIHDLMKTLTSKVDAMANKVNGIDSKVNALNGKVDRNTGKIDGIVNAVDAKIKNLTPYEMSYGYLEYTKLIGNTYPKSSSTHIDSAHTSLGQCNAFCLKVKKERSSEDWNSFSWRRSDGCCYCWRSGKSFAGNNGYISYTLEN